MFYTLSTTSIQVEFTVENNNLCCTSHIYTAGRKLSIAKQSVNRALRVHKRRGWLDALYEIQKRIREEEEEIRSLKQREQQLLNREYFKFQPSKEDRQEETHSGCAALTERRRRHRQKIGKREDSSACHAYLEDLERRCYPRLCIEAEEALLAFRLNYKPGQNE